MFEDIFIDQRISLDNFDHKDSPPSLPPSLSLSLSLSRQDSTSFDQLPLLMHIIIVFSEHV